MTAPTPDAPRCELLVGATSEPCILNEGHPGECSHGMTPYRSDNEPFMVGGPWLRNADPAMVKKLTDAAVKMARSALPVSTPGEPATPSEDIGTLTRRYGQACAVYGVTGTPEDEQAVTDARHALDARIAALEQERDDARTWVRSLLHKIDVMDRGAPTPLTGADPMTPPTRPSLPPELRERIDALYNATYDYGHHVALAEEYNAPRHRSLSDAVRATSAALDAALLPYVQDAEEADRGADDLQGEVDELADWQRRICELLTPEGDRGTLFEDMAEARIWELLRIERTAPDEIVRAARATTPAETPAHER